MFIDVLISVTVAVRYTVTDIDMLLMVEKGIRRGICHYIYWIQKLITNTWEIMKKIKNHLSSISGCK